MRLPTLLRVAGSSIVLTSVLLTACSSTDAAPVAPSSAVVKTTASSQPPASFASTAFTESSQSPASTESPPVTLATGAWPPGLTPAEQVSAQAALDAYTNFWRVKDAAGADPSGQDWRAELSKYSTGQILTDAMDFLRSLSETKRHREGTVKLTSKVVSVTPDVVTVESCFDQRDLAVVDSAGATVADSPSRVVGVQTALVQPQPDGSFKVTNLINPDPVQPC